MKKKINEELENIEKINKDQQHLVMKNGKHQDEELTTRREKKQHLDN